MPSSPLATREIGRHAVRSELARIAFDKFCLTGFEQVTFSDLASAAGVSRSTFLRHFDTKEDVVLYVFDPVEHVLLDSIRARAEGAGDWATLRKAVSEAVEILHRDVERLPAIMDLLGSTSALCARLRQKQIGWAPGLVAALREHPHAAEELDLVRQVRLAAAFECMWIVLTEWSTTGAAGDPRDLLDGAFSALAPTA